jgi:hypothetical protein
MRRNLSRLRRSKLVTAIVIGFGALIFVQLSGYQRWMKLFDAWDREAELREQVETLEKENKEIEETIRQLAPRRSTICSWPGIVASHVFPNTNVRRSPPLAAKVHSASVGNRMPAQPAKRSASDHETNTTGCSSSPGGIAYCSSFACQKSSQ